MEAAELCRGPQSPANTKRASFNRKLSREPQLYMAACLHLSFTKEGHNWDSVQIPECMPQVEQRYLLGKWSKWKLRVPQKKRAQVQNSHHVTCTVLPIHNSHHAPRTMLPLLRSTISQHKRENRDSAAILLVHCLSVYLFALEWDRVMEPRPACDLRSSLFLSSMAKTFRCATNMSPWASIHEQKHN